MPYKEEPARYLHRLLEVVEEAGYETTPYLSDGELTRQKIADPEYRITCAQYLDIVERILLDVDIPALGLKTGLRTTMADHGILGYAFLSSANLRKAFDIYSQYQKIVGPLLNVGVVEDGSEGVYICEPARYLKPDIYLFAIESWVAEATQWSSVFDKPALQFCSASVTHGPPAWSDEYAKVLGCSVKFGAPRTEIRFPADFLDIPFSLAQPAVAELCASQCDAILKQLDAQPDIVDDVRRVLLSKPGGMPKLNEVAARLYVSPRTLRRRLYEAGTSFREIVASVRMKLAEEYLANTMLPTAEIAFLLGYSDVTAFHRAFKKIHDVTPVAYRESVDRKTSYAGPGVLQDLPHVGQL